ncbi:MAG: hypothetical protein GY842_18600 [bacterium]|nr:hypothetical protein [bacterium]
MCQPDDGRSRRGHLTGIRRRPGYARVTHAILTLAALVAAALTLTARGALAEEITIALSSKAAPYVEAANELKNQLVGAGHTIRTVEIGKATKKSDLKGDSDAMFVAVGTPATTWLKANLPAQSPLVYCMTTDIEKVAKTGAPTAKRKIAGVSTKVPLKVQFGLIAEALPRATTIGVLYRSDKSKSVSLLADVKANLREGWKLHAVAVDKHKSVAKAIDALLAGDVDVVWTAPDSSVYNVATVRSLLLTAIRSRTPVFGFSRGFVRAGALLGVGIKPAHQGRQAAALVELLLKSAGATSPSATSQPRSKQLYPDPEFQLAVNLIVARKLSLTLPKSLISRAVHVFGSEEEGKK